MGTLFSALPLLFTKSNHSTLLEIHSSKGTSQYGGRDKISGRATRYGLTVRGSSPGGARFLVSVGTDHKTSDLFCKRWRPWCIYIYIYIYIYSQFFSAVVRNWVVMSRFFEVEALDSSRFIWSPWRHFSRHQNFMVVCWLTLSIRREKGDMWTQRK